MLTDKEYHSLKEISLKLFYEMIYVSNASEIVKYISALTYHLENVRSDYLPKESINPLPEGIDVMMELDRLECFYNESDTLIANTDLYDSVYVNTLLQLKRPLYEGVFQYYSQGKDSVQFFNQVFSCLLVKLLLDICLHSRGDQASGTNGQETEFLSFDRRTALQADPLQPWFGPL